MAIQHAIETINAMPQPCGLEASQNLHKNQGVQFPKYLMTFHELMLTVSTTPTRYVLQSMSLQFPHTNAGLKIERQAWHV